MAGMITRRDLIVAAVSVVLTAAVVALAQAPARQVMHSRVFNWNSVRAVPTKTGERRQFFDAATATLERFECHVTTLNPGEAPHAGHRHPDEELMIVKEGTLEAIQENRTNRVEPGGIIFEGSNEYHGVRNIGTNRATYYVLRWVTPGLANAGSK